MHILIEHSNFSGKPEIEADSTFRNVNETFRMKCHALSCDSQPAQLSFRRCPPKRSCDREWIEVAKKGPNDERVFRSPNGLVETITMNGRAHVSGEYKCTSECKGLSTTQRMLVIGIMFSATQRRISFMIKLFIDLNKWGIFE